MSKPGSVLPVLADLSHEDLEELRARLHAKLDPSGACGTPHTLGTPRDHRDAAHDLLDLCMERIKDAARARARDASALYEPDLWAAASVTMDLVGESFRRASLLEQ